MKATPKRKAHIGLALTLLFAIALVTGLLLHLQRHGIGTIGPHCAIKLIHVSTGIAMIGFVGWHGAQFYKMWQGMRVRFRWFWGATGLVALLAVAVLVTGVVRLLAPEAQFPHLGLEHYWFGIALTIVVAIHLIRGIPAYRRLRAAGKRR